MKKVFFLTIATVILALGQVSASKLALDIFPGAWGIGISSVSDTNAYGIDGGFYTSGYEDSSITYAELWGELRTKLDENNFYGYGLVGGIELGKDESVALDYEIYLAPFVDFGTYLSKNIILAVWCNPITIWQTKAAGTDGKLGLSTCEAGFAFSVLF